MRGVEGKYRYIKSVGVGNGEWGMGSRCLFTLGLLAREKEELMGREWK